MGRDETDGHQMTFAQGLLESIVQLAGFQFLPLFQIELHQCLVHFDHLVDDGGMGLGDAGKVALAGRIEEAIHDTLALVGQQIDRQTLVAEGFPNLFHQHRQIHVFRIDLVDNDHPTQAPFGGPFHHPVGDRLDPGLGVDHHRHRLHRWQHGNRLADKIRLPLPHHRTCSFPHPAIELSGVVPPQNSRKDLFLHGNSFHSAPSVSSTAQRNPRTPRWRFAPEFTGVPSHRRSEWLQ